MFVTSGQFDVFCLCLSFGAAWGLLAAFSAPLWDKLSNCLLRALLQLLFFCLAGMSFFFFRSAAGFPSARLYMLFGFLAGMFAVYKSFYQTVAKFYRKVYNRRKEKKAAKKT